MIFDTLNDKQRITVKWLKANGWTRGVWGEPDYYVDLPKDALGRTRFTGQRVSTARWRSNSFVWEKHDSVTGIHLIYFPKKFTKYANISIDPHPHDMIYISNIYETAHSEDVRQTNTYKARYVADLESIEILAKDKYECIR